MTGQPIQASSLLPLGYGAILVAPNGILPLMTRLRGPAHRILIHADAEARGGRRAYAAVFVDESGLIRKIIEQIGTLVVMYAKALLLYKGIGRAKIQLQTGG